MRIPRRQLLSAPAALFQSPRPNVLLILTDQQTHDAWSGCGNPWLKTPAMDSIARRGLSFRNAICPYPVCSPSRASIFTGRLPHEAGVMDNGKPIAPGMATLGELFRSAGYNTAYGGKWHLPKSFDGMTGFTKIIGGSALGKDMDAPLSNACADWLRKQPNSPFLLVASFMNPHDICDWIRQHKGSREFPNPDRFPPAPANMAVDPAEPEAIQYHRTAGYDLMSQAVGIASEWRRDDMRLYLHDYYRMVEQVDAEIGKVLSALRETGQESNTVILLASDHGEGLGAHRWAQKASFYEESLRVPFFLAGPGIRPGVDRGLATLADIVPTLCGVAGIKPPPDLRGIDLLNKSERRFVASQLRYESPEREGRLLLTARYKYVRFNSGARPEQLFDLHADPGETLNLAHVPTAHGLLEEHRRLLANYLDQTADTFLKTMR
jgi:arylsulfatase A-like enzyme